MLLAAQSGSLDAHRAIPTLPELIGALGGGFQKAAAPASGDSAQTTWRDALFDAGLQSHDIASADLDVSPDSKRPPENTVHHSGSYRLMASVINDTT
jgi:hypothetical protein